MQKIRTGKILKSNALVSAFNKLSANEQRLVALAAAKVTERYSDEQIEQITEDLNSTENRQRQIAPICLGKVEDILEHYELNKKHRKPVQNAIRKLTTTQFALKNPIDFEIFTNIFTESSICRASGNVYVTFNVGLVPLFHEFYLKEKKGRRGYYTEWHEYTWNLKGTALAVYDLLNAKSGKTLNVAEFEIGKEEFLHLMNVEILNPKGKTDLTVAEIKKKNANTIRRFHGRILPKALQEISSKTNMIVSVEFVKNGKTIVGYRFKTDSNYENLLLEHKVSYSQNYHQVPKRDFHKRLMSRFNCTFSIASRIWLYSYIQGLDEEKVLEKMVQIFAIGKRGK